MRRARSCGVLVVRGDPIASFLLMKHEKRWDLPKGHIDGNETDIECALRELWEETGITAHDVAIDPEFRYVAEYEFRTRARKPETIRKTLVIFLGRLLREVEIKVSEHPDYSWMTWSPPHHIQEQTIDPLMRAAERYLSGEKV